MCVGGGGGIFNFFFFFFFLGGGGVERLCVCVWGGGPGFMTSHPVQTKKRVLYDANSEQDSSTSFMIVSPVSFNPFSKLETLLVLTEQMQIMIPSFLSFIYHICSFCYSHNYYKHYSYQDYYYNSK